MFGVSEHQPSAHWGGHSKPPCLAEAPAGASQCAGEVSMEGDFLRARKFLVLAGAQCSKSNDGVSRAEACGGSRGGSGGIAVAAAMMSFCPVQRSTPACLTLVTTGEAASRHPRDLNVCVLLAGLDQLALTVSPFQCLLKMCQFAGFDQAF